MLAIETHNLHKAFSPQVGWWRKKDQSPTIAVQDVSLRVPQGEIFGLLGPNGAGKTTLTKMLCTLILPTSGTGTVAGIPLTNGQAIRQKVGLVVTDERSFYWRLTGHHNLSFFAAMHGLYGKDAGKRIDEVLEAVNMREHAQRWFSSYSTGMKQRFAIARALLHRPQILFLDEPSRSLDPIATKNLHQLVRHLQTDYKVTIFLITHDLLEAETLCQQVAVMNLGCIQTVGKPATLRRDLQPQRHYTLHVSGEISLEPLRALVSNLTLSEPYLTFHAPETDDTLDHILTELHTQRVTIYSIEGQPPSLEEVFDHYTHL